MWQESDEGEDKCSNAEKQSDEEKCFKILNNTLINAYEYERKDYYSLFIIYSETYYWHYNNQSGCKSANLNY